MPSRPPARCTPRRAQCATTRSRRAARCETGDHVCRPPSRRRRARPLRETVRREITTCSDPTTSESSPRATGLLRADRPSAQCREPRNCTAVSDRSFSSCARSCNAAMCTRQAATGSLTSRRVTAAISSQRRAVSGSPKRLAAHPSVGHAMIVHAVARRETRSVVIPADAVAPRGPRARGRRLRTSWGRRHPTSARAQSRRWQAQQSRASRECDRAAPQPH